MRLALVHGFTQTGRSWAPMVAMLEAAGHQVVTPDLAGHGSKATTETDLRGAAQDLADEVGPATWVGYSLGGRVALHLALDRPDATAGLVLVSTTACIDDPDQRAARRRADEELARRLETEGVPRFVDRWLAGPLWATLGHGARGVEARLANTAAGLASSLRLAGTGSQAPLWDRLAAVTAPAMVVTGGLDTTYGALGDRLAQGMGPGTTRATFPEVGHAVPWEAPLAFARLLLAWLEATGGGGGGRGASQGPRPR